MAPRLDTLESHNNQRKPLSEMQNGGEADFPFRIPTSPNRKTKDMTTVDVQKSTRDIKKMLCTLKEQLAAVIATKPGRVGASSAGKIILNDILPYFIKGGACPGGRHFFSVFGNFFFLRIQWIFFKLWGCFISTLNYIW